MLQNHLDHLKRVQALFVLVLVHFFIGLTDNCRDCATHCLQYLKELKMKATLPRADPTAVRYVVKRILNQGQVRWARDGIFRLYTLLVFAWSNK